MFLDEFSDLFDKFEIIPVPVNDLLAVRRAR